MKIIRPPFTSIANLPNPGSGQDIVLQWDESAGTWVAKVRLDFALETAITSFTSNQQYITKKWGEDNFGQAAQANIFIARDGSNTVLGDIDFNSNNLVGVGTSGANTYIQSTKPTTIGPSGSIWVDPDDQEMFVSDGTDWMGVRFAVKIAFGSNTPYTSNAAMRVGNALVPTTHDGMLADDNLRLETVELHSDRSIGTVPSSSCGVDFYVNGSKIGSTHNWSGLTYQLKFTLNYDLTGDSDRWTMQYIDDAVGQSAGRVVGYIWLRRRIAG